MRSMLLISAALILSACPSAPQSKPIPGAFETQGPVVLTANGNPMHQEVLDLAEARIPAGQLEQIKASGQYKQIVEQFAIGNVLYHQALEKGLQDRRDVQLRIALATRDALAQALLEDVTKAAVTDEKIKAAYDERKVRYVQPGANVDIAIFGTVDEAKSAAELVKAGKTLAIAAKESGGGLQPLGWTTKGGLAGTIDAAVFNNDTIGLLEPIEMGGRVILIQVSDRRQSTPLSEVEGELRKELESQAVQEYTDKVRAEAKIVWTEAAASAELPSSDKPADPAAAAPAANADAAPAAQ